MPPIPHPAACTCGTPGHVDVQRQEAPKSRTGALYRLVCTVCQRSSEWVPTDEAAIQAWNGLHAPPPA
jgi:hypothetical protein